MAEGAYVFVAGHYTAAFTGNGQTSLNIGTTEVGFEMRPTFYREDIKADDFGDTLIDGIYRGANVSLTFELIEWRANATALMWPVNAADGDMGTVSGNALSLVGMTMQSLAGSLVLTPVTGISASLKTYTFLKVIPDGQHGGFSFNSRLRRMRCSLLCLPDIMNATATSRGKIYTVSA